MLALLVGGIVTIAVLGSQTSWFQDWLRRYVVREANDAMNGELAIGRLRGNLVTGVTLSDLAIRQHGAVVVRADEAQVTYDIRDFLSRAIVLRHVLGLFGGERLVSQAVLLGPLAVIRREP